MNALVFKSLEILITCNGLPLEDTEYGVSICISNKHPDDSDATVSADYT